MPASAADAIWLARDLAALIDEIETEERRLGEAWRTGVRQSRRMVAGDAGFPGDRHVALAGWPARARPLQPGRAPQRADPEWKPTAVANAPAVGPVIAAGSTGSIPATAEAARPVICAACRNGAVVLPGLDLALDERSWSVIATGAPHPSVFGHPQFGLAKLLRKIGLNRAATSPRSGPCRGAGWYARTDPRRRTASGADHRRLERRSQRLHGRRVRRRPCRRVTLVEAANERDEALTIATALRGASRRAQGHGGAGHQRPRPGAAGQRRTAALRYPGRRFRRYAAGSHAAGRTPRRCCSKPCSGRAIRCRSLPC